MRRFPLGALPRLEGPPTEVTWEELACEVRVGLAVKIDELLVASIGVVPGPHSGAHVLQMMVEGAHLHDRRAFQSLEDLKGEFRLVVPGVLASRHGVAPIKRVEIDHVEASSVVEFGRFGCDFREQGRVTVGQEPSETLSQMVDGCPFLVGSDGRAIGAASTLG